MAVSAGRELHHRIEWALLGVPEDREQRRAFALINRVIPPLAAHDLAAIERKQLVELGAAEEDSLGLAPVVAEAVERRHPPPALRNYLVDTHDTDFS